MGSKAPFAFDNLFSALFIVSALSIHWVMGFDNFNKFIKFKYLLRGLS